MAYTLKSTGIATKAVSCLAVDEDGTTIKEFANATADSQKTIGASVGIGGGTWKSVSRNYFSTANSADGSIVYGTTKPQIVSSSTAQASVFMAAQDIAAAAFNYGAIVSFSSNNSSDWWGRSYSNSGRPSFFIASGHRVTATGAPSTTDKFSIGMTLNDSSTSLNAAYYGLDSDEDTTNSLNVNGIYGRTLPLYQVGGASFSNGKIYLLALFNDDLTSEEWQSLHDDPWAALFDSSGASAVAKRLMTMGIGS